MQKLRLSKNIKTVDGVKVYNRWVVLNVEVNVVNMIRKYAKRHQVTIRRAFSEMIKKAHEHDTKD